jgi:accessory gene regulator B
MLRAMCEDVSFVLVRNRIISEDDREIYIYGLELILNSLLVAGTIVTLGILLNRIVITIIFLTVFSSIRSYSGGYHANQYWKCYCVGCSAYLSVIIIVNSTVVSQVKIESLIFLAVSYIMIFGIGPLNSEKNPKTEKEMRKNSIISKILISVYTTISGIGVIIYPQAIELWLTVACTQLVVAIFLMITILQRRYLR